MPGQKLNVGDELASPNGLVRLEMQANGNLVLYRTAFAEPLWFSGTAGQPVNHTIMQAGGDLVAYSPSGVAYWSTSTAGNAGAWLKLRDDGDLVLYGTANTVLWETSTVQDFTSLTYGYADSNGYVYVENSEWWKQACSLLPCSMALQWPDYATTIVEDVIDGEPVVIQLRKGWCEKPLGFQTLPGGIGAEVGIYRRIEGRAPGQLWWPFPELNATVEFNLINTVTGQTFFPAGPETTYWLCKWMNEDSYTQYQRDQGKRWSALPSWWPFNSETPFFAVNYLLEYTVNGKSYPPW